MKEKAGSVWLTSCVWTTELENDAINLWDPSFDIWLWQLYQDVKLIKEVKTWSRSRVHELLRLVETETVAPAQGGPASEGQLSPSGQSRAQRHQDYRALRHKAGIHAFICSAAGVFCVCFTISGTGNTKRVSHAPAFKTHSSNSSLMSM